jgi:hypothetical protein
MDRETYIAPIVEAYIPDAETSEKLALTNEFLGFFDQLATINNTYRFDNKHPKMLEFEPGERPVHRSPL